MKGGSDLSRIIKFVDREVWRDPFQDAISDHCGEEMEALILSPVTSVICWGITTQAFSSVARLKI